MAHVCIDIDLSIFFLVKVFFLSDVLNSSIHDVLNSSKQFRCIFQV